MCARFYLLVWERLVWNIRIRWESSGCMWVILQTVRGLVEPFLEGLVWGGFLIDRLTLYLSSEP